MVQRPLHCKPFVWFKELCTVNHLYGKLNVWFNEANRLLHLVSLESLKSSPRPTLTSFSLTQVSLEALKSSLRPTLTSFSLPGLLGVSQEFSQGGSVRPWRLAGGEVMQHHVPLQGGEEAIRLGAAHILRYQKLSNLTSSHLIIFFL